MPETSDRLSTEGEADDVIILQLTEAEALDLEKLLEYAIDGKGNPLAPVLDKLYGQLDSIKEIE